MSSGWIPFHCLICSVDHLSRTSLNKSSQKVKRMKAERSKQTKKCAKVKLTKRSESVAVDDGNEEADLLSKSLICSFDSEEGEDSRPSTITPTNFGATSLGGSLMDQILNDRKKVRLILENCQTIY